MAEYNSLMEVLYSLKVWGTAWCSGFCSVKGAERFYAYYQVV